MYTCRSRTLIVKGKLGKNQWEKRKIKFAAFVQSTAPYSHSKCAIHIPQLHWCTKRKRVQQITTHTVINSGNVPVSAQPLQGNSGSREEGGVRKRDCKWRQNAGKTFTHISGKSLFSFIPSVLAGISVSGGGQHVCKCDRHRIGRIWRSLAGHRRSCWKSVWSLVGQSVHHQFIFSSFKLLHYKDMFPLYKI